MSPHLAIANALRPFLATGIWAEKAHHTVKAGPRKIQAKGRTSPASPILNGRPCPSAFFVLASGLRTKSPMRLKSACLLLFLASCEEGPPPFDELPLRDALRADPAMIASLPEAARSKLATRLETVRTSDVAIDHVGENETEAPTTMVAALDHARQHRQAEPLMVGFIRAGAAWPIGDRMSAPNTPALPPIEGVSAVATAQIEKRALDTKAGAAVRALLAASGAQHLQRVVGWPIGAVAIDDTVYVNASWLVAIAPDNEKVDGGADAKASSVGSQAGASEPKRPIVGPPLGIKTVEEKDTPATSDSSPILRETFTMANRPDAGPTTSTTSSSRSNNVVLDDACSSCADSCATSSSDSCDTSNESSNSCDTSDESTDNSCNSSADDSSQDCSSTSDSSSQACSSTDEGAATCQVAYGGRRKSPGTLPWLLAPLGFLLFRRRS
jgi:hypothetical protein